MLSKFIIFETLVLLLKNEVIYRVTVFINFRVNLFTKIMYHFSTFILKLSLIQYNGFKVANKTSWKHRTEWWIKMDLFCFID